MAFAEELIELARANARIVAVCNDSVGSSNLGAFAAEFPDRLINVGIAEQNMVGVGAGLALSRYVPIVFAAAPFLTGRALEQIKADVPYSQAPVVLCGMGPGMAYGNSAPPKEVLGGFSQSLTRWPPSAGDQHITNVQEPEQHHALGRHLPVAHAS